MTLLLDNLNALAGGLFLITAFGIIAIRQVQDCLRFFIFQSIFLAVSAFVSGRRDRFPGISSRWELLHL